MKAWSDIQGISALHRLHGLCFLFGVFAIFVLSCLLTGCANSLPPGGGPPDKTPPKVLFTDPANKSLNVHPTFVTVQFSKYIRKEQFSQNIFLTPSVKTELSWAGKWLYITFAEPLDSNVTVALTLGTQYTDWQNNKPEAAHTLIFATGAKLDSGSIRGTLDAEKPEGVFVFLYPLHQAGRNADTLRSRAVSTAPIALDTLNPSHTKPKYRTQLGSKGTFEFQALAAGVYRIFAVRDEYRDDLINAGDAVGCATRDIRIAEGSTATLTLRIAPPEDRTPPALFDVQAVSTKHLRVKFSEKLDTASIRASSFLIADSASVSTAASVRVVAAHLSTSNSSFVDVYTAEALHPSVRWRLVAQVRDSAGNHIPDSAQTSYFKASEVADTVLPRLLSVSVQDSAKDITLNTRFQAVFSAAIDSAFADAAFALTLDDKAAPKGTVAPRLRVVRKAANIIVVEPQTPLVNNAWHTLTFSLASFKALSTFSSASSGAASGGGNAEARTLGDSVVSIHFQTEDTRGSGGVSGVVVDSLQGDSVYAPSGGYLPKTKSMIRDDSLRSKGKYVILLETKDASALASSGTSIAGGATNALGNTPAGAPMGAATNAPSYSPTSSIKRAFQCVIAKPDKWEFTDIPPGTYRLTAFYDANGNGVYDYGTPFPFRPAERFTVFAGEVSIRPRWTIENVRIVFP
jgi:uncharacterized protein (DUF2141 family)